MAENIDKKIKRQVGNVQQSCETAVQTLDQIEGILIVYVRCTVLQSLKMKCEGSCLCKEKTSAVDARGCKCEATFLKVFRKIAVQFNNPRFKSNKGVGSAYFWKLLGCCLKSQFLSYVTFTVSLSHSMLNSFTIFFFFFFINNFDFFYLK